MSGRSAAAPKLLAGGAAGPETIDKVWCIDREAPEGPFHNPDRVGLHTAYDIYAASGDLKPQAAARHVKEHHTDQGKLGQPTGEGFFNTPPPEIRHRPLSKTMFRALYPAKADARRALLEPTAGHALVCAGEARRRTASGLAMGHAAPLRRCPPQLTRSLPTYHEGVRRHAGPT